MPRYMTLIRIDEQARDGWEPDPGFEQRMGALFDEITRAGVMLETAGLTPTAQGTRLSWADGKIDYTDGPFTETKEVVGGYAILQCKDTAEALEWTRRFLQTHPVTWQVEAEVRQIDEAPEPPK
ncbi:YciI family protein [Streptomyces rubellomurinus]|uniref:YciI family protein n=1 Tax=Streptomyces sp. Y1 TaxID=3238634 RepID=A0AB39TR17_9ACTN|nr:transcriptional regulator [Streptomyces rubellomurinus subsp. indigoferus]KJS56814.1 transcriptional regulator [Streptomyces rubellomurinus subsp. indigoferus]